jgi:hypothetical protein
VAADSDAVVKAGSASRDTKLSSSHRGSEAPEAQARKLDNFIAHCALYGIAFLNSDTSGVDMERRRFAAHSDLENFGLSLDSDTEAYAGRMRKA